MVLQFSLLLLLLPSMFLIPVFSGPHAHELERDEHGAFSPRDSQHYKGGDHHSDFDHEAVLGSHNAAEEYGRLSPNEARIRLKELATKMDKDRDGHVDKEELTQWVMHSFSLLTEEEARERLEEEDGNEDGRVAWREHLEETFGADQDEDNNVDSNRIAEEKKMMQEDKELFEAADLDGDGSLDAKEFPGFSHPEEFPHMHKVLVTQTMRKKDKDGDGSLSLQEYLREDDDRPIDQNSEYFAIETDKFQQDYDKNHNGRLDPGEVLAWLVPDNRDMAETEAEHLIESSDDDLDGRLSLREIVDHHDIFVGSEVTDFGEHLQNTHKFSDEL